jgi:hypothetical protein
LVMEEAKNHGNGTTPYHEGSYNVYAFMEEELNRFDTVQGRRPWRAIDRYDDEVEMTSIEGERDKNGGDGPVKRCGQ